MLDKCPECSTPMKSNVCPCGYEKPYVPKEVDSTHYVECQEGIMAGRCVMRENGERCPNPGTMSHSVRGGDTWYCRDHWRRVG